jgi:hypothetical protein
MKMRTFSLLNNFLAIAAIALTLTACGVGMQKEKPGINDQGTFNETYKPKDDDFVGTSQGLFGSWSGPCKYMSSSGVASSSCNLTVDLQNSSGIITGQARVTADGLTHIVDLKSYSMFGNVLKNLSNNQDAGRIGSSAIEIYDSAFGQTSAKLVDGQLGFMMRSVPGARSISYQLWGALDKQ